MNPNLQLILFIRYGLKNNLRNFESIKQNHLQLYVQRMDRSLFNVEWEMSIVRPIEKS